MSLFDDASLVLIPDGAKDGKLYSVKPTDGTGDFTFTRGSNLAATRVDENGLIEKGRENLILQSNQFDTTWQTQSASVTSGQSGYDGSSNAWLFSHSSSTAFLYQPKILSASINTISIYVKKGTSSTIRLDFVTGAFGKGAVCSFDLENGTAGSVTHYGSSSGFLATINTVSNGWYRISLTGVTTAETWYHELTLTSGNIYIQDAQLEAGLVATDYIETGATTAQAGILEDLPRIDYSGGASCPALLLEPQRSNLITNSEYFGSGSGWSLLSGGSFSFNQTTSPEGLQNASLLSGDGVNANAAYFGASVTSGSSYSFSLFAKANGQNLLRMRGFSVSAGGNVIFDLSNGTINTAPNDDLSNAKIEAIGDDGWYRCSVVATADATDSNALFGFDYSDSSASGGLFYIYGVQFELGSYPTSYIPTYGSSVTRSGDVCTKTSATSLIGQEQGTIFLDFVNSSYTSSTNVLFQLRISGGSGTQVDIRLFGGAIIALANNGGVNQFSMYTFSASIGTRYKCALRYLENDSAFYINGAKVGSDTSCTFTSGSLDQISFAENLFYLVEKQKINQALIFKTALTDEELSALTRPYNTYQEWVDGEGLTWESKSCTNQSILELQNL